MDITLEMIDQIRERAGVSYEQAKKALEEADGSVVDALIALEKADKETSHEVIDTIKAMIRKGNVTKVSMKKDGRTLLTVPVNAGVAGGVLGFMAAPWAVIAAGIAAYGLDCSFELLKEDGTVETLFAGRSHREAPVEECAGEPAEEAADEPTEE
ncbi:MAG: DUF4342 domain-containing protein [Oscillospiraceae bacterium]|jgi:hypothetical protein|nr:DUF4342 domain-containing protein [Oscillospiraceae bacterium]